MDKQRSFTHAHSHTIWRQRMHRLVLAVSIVVLLASPAVAQQERNHRTLTGLTPVGANLERYPLEARRLSTGRVAELGLRPVQLRYPWTGYNFHREVEGGRWILETLPAGTIVLVDGKGDQIYKEDCGNRLIWVPQVVSSRTSSVPTTRVEPVARQVGERSLWTGLGDLFRDLAKTSWSFIWEFLRALGFLALALLPFLLLALLIYAISSYFRYRNNGVQPRSASPSAHQATDDTPRGVSQGASIESKGSSAQATNPNSDTRTAGGTPRRRFMSYSAPEGHHDADHRVRFGGFRRVDMHEDPSDDGGSTITIRMYI